MRTGLIAMFLIAASSAQAWNGTGHMTVAYVAYQNLTPQTRARVDQLLTLNPMYATWTAKTPAAQKGLVALLSAATWSDCIKRGCQMSGLPRRWGRYRRHATLGSSGFSKYRLLRQGHAQVLALRGSAFFTCRIAGAGSEEFQRGASNPDLYGRHWRKRFRQHQVLRGGMAGASRWRHSSAAACGVALHKESSHRGSGRERCEVLQLTMRRESARLLGRPARNNNRP
jgi:hypothetical protein